MSESPFRSGEFAWSAFPERENPVRPGPRHVGYIALSTSSDSGPNAMVAYTTSQPWGGAKPPGVRSFDREQAAEMGQQRPFTIDLRRMAFVPVRENWFPDLGQPGNGVVGRAPKKVRQELEAEAKTLFEKHRENVERLGPLWPRR